MPVFAVFEQTSFFGACPNVSRTPPSSPGAGVLGGGSQLRKDCCCHDTSFGGVFDLPPLSDDTEAFPKASVQARLDAFLASKGAARKGCHATEMAGGGFAWTTDSDAVSFISDGRLSLALQARSLCFGVLVSCSPRGAQALTRGAAGHRHGPGGGGRRQG